MGHHRRATSRIVPAAAVLLVALLQPAVVHGGPLPRLIVSLAPGIDLTTAAQTIRASGLQDAVMVLPPTSVVIAGAGKPGAAVPSPVIAVPALAGADTYIHLIVDISQVGSGETADRESAVDRGLDGIIGWLAAEGGAAKGLLVEVAGAREAPATMAFAMATLAVRAKGARPGLHVNMVLPSGSDPSARDLIRRVAAYADSVTLDVDTVAARAVELPAGTAVVARLGGRSAGHTELVPGALLDFLVGAAIPAPEMIWAEVQTLGDLQALGKSIDFLTRALAGGFEMTRPERAPVAVVIDGRPAEPAVAFVGSQTADVALLVKVGATTDVPRDLGVVQAAGTATRLSCHDAVDGRALPAPTASSCRADTEYVLARVTHAGGEERLFEAVSVKGRAELRVEEIIARWQSAREADRRALQHYLVPCLLGLHFEAGGTLGVAFDVALDLHYFAEPPDVQEWVQKSFFINGVRFKQGSEFPLPMLEPDKVVARPLELSLNERYEYLLLGTDNVNDALCYVVGIEPATTDEALYAGKVWIDGLSFQQVRLQLEQRTGKNNVAAHIETQEFERVPDGHGRDFTLLKSIHAQDTINLAGRSVVVEKAYAFGDYAINAPDFAARLAAARSSNDPMYKDTEEGLRAFRKEGESQTRTVQPMSGKKVSSLVGGMLYDGSLDFPVPLIGWSWIDFKFRGTDSQFSALFAGLFLSMNLSRQWNEKVRTGLDVQVSALPSTDRVYSGSQEIEAEQVRSFQQWAAARVDWQASAGWSFATMAQGSLYTYMATSKTDPEFRVPADAVVLEAIGEGKYAHRAFTFTGTIDQAVRLGGGAYGYPDDPRQLRASPSFRRYSAEASQRVFAGKLTRAGISAAFFGGDHLNRFSRYKPSVMSRPKMRGVPRGNRVIRPGRDGRRPLRLQRAGLVQARRLVQSRVDAQPRRVATVPAVRRARLQRRAGRALEHLYSGVGRRGLERQPRPISFALGLCT